MIGYIAQGTNYLFKFATFFVELIKGLGAKSFFNTEILIAWYASSGQLVVPFAKSVEDNRPVLFLFLEAWFLGF